MEKILMEWSWNSERRRTEGRLLALGLLFFAFAGCQSRSRPNVLLITVDTLRADHLGCYGFKLAHTKAIDALAAEGVRCTDDIAVAPITLPSHSSIMTGLLPPTHGVRDNGSYSLGDSNVTLAERLRAAGYTTQAFVSALVLNRRYGLDQGFENYDDDLWAEDSPKMFMIRDRRADKTATRFLGWLETWQQDQKRRPFFVWTHFFDPHQPYNPPAAYRTQAPSLYDGEIASVDHAIGRIVSQLREYNILDKTLIIFTADHGESLGEHQEKTHALFIYDATVHVPLIYRYPGSIPSNRVYEGPVRSVDIVPTVLSLLKLPGGEETQGVNLLPALRGQAPPPQLAQYSESLLSEVGFGMAPLHGVRLQGYKFILAPKPELYDLKKDPNELNNLYSADPTRAARLKRELEGIMADSERRARPVKNNPMNKETMEMLFSLGYVAPAQQRKSMSGMDPKDGLPIYNKLEDARHLAQNQKWSQSEKLLREILDVLPAHVTARNILALALMRQHKLDQAKEQYRESLHTDPLQSRVYLMLGSLALVKEDLNEAEKNYLAAIKITPGFVEATSNLGFIEALRNHPEKAKEWYDKAVAEDPKFPAVYRRVGDLYYDKGEYKQALQYYEKTLETEAGHFEVIIQSGNCERRLGLLAEAIASYKSAEKLRPDAWIPRYSLACLEAQGGDIQKAFVHLREAMDRGFANPELLEEDRDWENLRNHPDFKLALKRAQERRGTDD
jgi:arylsulfatase A-like enzyme/Tfp pilus assembly protein PilF